MEKLKFPLKVVISAIALAFSVGGAAMAVKAQAAENEKRLTAVETKTQSAEERLLRIEITTGQTGEDVKWIKRRLNRDHE